MLRVQFSKEGEQRFLPYIFNAPVQIYDIRGWEKEKIKHKILSQEGRNDNLNNNDPEKDICLIYVCSSMTMRAFYACHWIC